MGRGHSGSTLLDTVLGNSRHIESVGELVSALQRIDSEVCSCGKKMTDCEYWVAIVESFKKENLENSFRDFCKKSIQQANIKNFIPTLFLSNQYKKNIESSFVFFKKISQRSKKQYVLDSSKEHTRALLFSRSENTNIIHIVRRPDRILASTYFRAINGETVKILRRKFKPSNPFFFFLYIFTMSLSWTVGNLFAEIVKTVSKNKVLTIRYEDFVQNPVSQLNKIQNHFSIDLQELIDKIKKKEKLIIGHNVGGNRFRFQKTFKIQPKKSAERQLPTGYRILTKLINFPFMLFYSYNPFK